MRLACSSMEVKPGGDILDLGTAIRNKDIHLSVRDSVNSWALLKLSG